MLKKIIVRLLLLSILFAVTIASIAAYGGWMAFQHPPFYSKLKAQTFTEQDRDRAKMKLEFIAASISMVNRSDKHSGKHKPSQVAAEFTRDTPPAKPAAVPGFEYRLSQNELNALFTDKKLGKDLQSVRVQMADQRIRLGADLELSEKSRLPIVLEFQLSTNRQNQIRLDIVGGQLGRVPMPIVWLLNQLPPNALKTSGRLTPHLSDPQPHFIWDLKASSAGKLAIQQDGTDLVLAFQPAEELK